jgi:hypothetical protein
MAVNDFKHERLGRSEQGVKPRSPMTSVDGMSEIPLITPKQRNVFNGLIHNRDLTDGQRLCAFGIPDGVASDSTFFLPALRQAERSGE